MHRGLLVAIAVSGLVLVVTPIAYALLNQQGVKTSRRYEVLPAAATDGADQYFSWSQNSKAHRKHFDAFFARTGDARVKLNPTGQGFSGGIDPPTVVYQQVSNGQSNLRLYDADTQVRSSPPAGVNTKRWEWSPTLSGDWLLFGRINASTGVDSVVLHSMSSSTQFLLDQGASSRAPGQVNGDFAVWSRCDGPCDVIRRQISTSTDTTLPKPLTSTYQYAPAVTSTGIVYLARSGKSCGSNVRIVRFFGASDPPGGTVVAALGSGRDTFQLFARENADGSVDVFYDRLSCSNSNVADIYRVQDPHPGP
jgi:hypothetical protein